jgi:hypothetical protein
MDEGVRQTSYTSNPVNLPPNFLTTLPPDAHLITTSRIDFANTALSQYKDAYALVLENVLSPSECTTLLSLAEQSATNREAPWQPALVNVGGNYEAPAPDYRNSDRIIWDEQTVVDRLVARILAADDGRLSRDVSFLSLSSKSSEGIVGSLLSRFGRSENVPTGADIKSVIGPRAAQTQSWTMTRGNERMRFLRYMDGHFFNRHCDGSYVSPANPESRKPEERTLFTVHLYLSGTDEEPIGGGATSFYGSLWDDRNETAKLDVEAKMGRVLVFQHRGESDSCGLVCQI